MEKILSLSPSHLDALVWSAEILRDIGNTEQSEKLFDKAKGDIETYRKKYNHTIHDETDDDNASDEILDHELKTSIRTQLSAVLLTHRSRGQI